MNLNDVFPDGLMGEGIFYALNNYNVPWKDSISSLALDLEYYGNVSGGKTISPLLRRLLVDGVVSQSSLTRLANSLYSMNALRWTKLWATYELEYNPIENYRMSEIMSDDDTVTTYGRTHHKTGTESDDRTRTDESTDGIYGFNSSSASDSQSSDRTIDDDNTHTYNLTDADTGTDTQSHSYELTRSGNIGVTTSQQMIESERSLWMWRYFYDVVFPDVDKMLTIAIYSDDFTPVISGGITPTGEINIILNGEYDVTEYATAVVNVPNTYNESDNGLVVYNGELVSQIGRDITANGAYDTTLNNAVLVNVPNTYTAADEGKVVDNGALVAQGSQTITENGTYDTTLIDEINVQVAAGAAVLWSNDQTLAVLIDTENSRLVWYFMGFTKTSSDVAIPQGIFIGQSGLIYSKGYGPDKETQIGQIGFYNDTIRSWNIATTQTMAGTFWGVVYSNGGEAQSNPYSDPPA